MFIIYVIIYHVVISEGYCILFCYQLKFGHVWPPSFTVSLNVELMLGLLSI